MITEVEPASNHCGLFWRPDRIVTHNRTGKPFQDFVESWNIIHMANSPWYPRNNGLAEQAAKQQNLDKGLLNIWATTISAPLSLPSELLHGQAPVTLLPEPLRAKSWTLAPGTEREEGVDPIPEWYYKEMGSTTIIHWRTSENSWQNIQRLGAQDTASQVWWTPWLYSQDT